MAKAKKYRWVCPTCGKGALGPQRPPADATMRFCLPCSKRSTTLVARTCPALDRARERRTEVAVKRRATASATRARARAKKKELAESKWTYEGIDLRDEVPKLLAVARREGYPVRRPSMTVSQREWGSHCTGRSWYWQRRIHLTIPKGCKAGPAVVILAHELAHQAAPAGSHHGPEWRYLFRTMVESVYGVRVVDHGSYNALHETLERAVADKMAAPALEPAGAADQLAASLH